MLWVNLVMDTMGALALGTETPTPDLLNRRPYKRSATLISRPMLRNIIVQGTYQLLLLLLLMFEAPEWFGLREGVGCLKYDIDTGSSARWNSTSGALSFNTSLPYSVSCQDFKDECGDHHQMNCYENNAYAFRTRGGEMKSWKFSDLPDFEKECLSQCIKKDYTHGTVVFNTFIFCQVIRHIAVA
jgi:magnesium-transporting ATPase (P-type)